MLEQELNNQQVNSNFNDNTKLPPQPQYLPEAELFEQYEIKNWNFSPRLYKIVAVSAVFNILALFVFTQGNLLTTRGCDSPMVSKVCQVLDTVYVGGVLFGTDSEFVSKDYDPTNLEDAEITYIDVSGQTPPLTYPEGYFAIANPEEFALRQQQMMNAENPNGFEMPPTGSIPFPGMSSNQPPMSSTPDLMNTKPSFPKPNNNAVIGDLPTSTSGRNPIASNPTRKFPRPKNQRPTKAISNESPNELPDLDEDDTAENKSDKDKKPDPKQQDVNSLPVAEEIINKKPLQDFGEDVLDKVEAKKVDLTKAFMVVMEGTITKEGKFDPKKSGYVKLDGDQEMVNVAKSAIEAIGDSGILTYLQKFDVEKINFTLVQDDKQIYAIITSDQKSESKAKTVSSGLNTAISIGKATVKEEDTLALLNAAKVENKGKSFVLNFKLDKNIAQELINRQLQKAQAKRQQKQTPNGTAEAKPNQNSAK